MSASRQCPLRCAADPVVAERDVPPLATDPRLERARRQIAILENMIEDKTRSLYLAQEELRAKSAFLERILESMTSALVVTDNDGAITMVGGSTAALTGRAPSDLIGGPIATVLRADAPSSEAPNGEPTDAFLVTAEDTEIPVIVSTSSLAAGAEEAGYVYVATDVSRQRSLEAELRRAQKLESIGQLAAGVAHEINTPIQFVGDSVNFLGEAITDSLELLAAYGAFRDKAAGHTPLEADLDALRDLEEECDLEFIVEEAPRSIERTKDGVRRVAEIVAAMKQFSHPGGGPMTAANINEIIQNTLVVARNEYKYAAGTGVGSRELRSGAVRSRRYLTGRAQPGCERRTRHPGSLAGRRTGFDSSHDPRSRRWSRTLCAGLRWRGPRTHP